MGNWFIKGLQTGIVTSRYPSSEEKAAGVSPGRPQRTERNDHTAAETLAGRCPTEALRTQDNEVIVESKRCVHCFRCVRGIEQPGNWGTDYEWATVRSDMEALPKTFQKSLHIRVVDAGDCGACLNETKLLNNPFYNMHRLGFFITPTPRKADILLITGPLTHHLKESVLKVYEAMPEPKRVIAAGTCALSGGVFKDGFVTGTRISDILPVDIEIPGCPPPPLAILHGLLSITGRREAGHFISEPDPVEKEGGNTK